MPQYESDRDYSGRDTRDRHRASDSEKNRERRRERRRESERRHSRGAGGDTADEHHYDSDRYHTRRRRGHRATDSQGDLLLPPPAAARRHENSESEWDTPASPSPRRTREERRGSRSTPARGESTRASGSRSRGTRESSTAAPLSLDALARLDKVNARRSGWGAYDYDGEYLKEVRRKEEKLEKERRKMEKEERNRAKRRTYESDGAGVERRERKKEEDRRKGYTDDEGKRMGYTESEIEEKKRRYKEKYTPSERAERRARRQEEKRHRTEQKKRRVISGPLAEEGGIDDDDEYRYMMEKRGGGGSEPSDLTEDEGARRKKLKRILIGVLCFLIVLAIIIPVAVMMSKKHSEDIPKSEAASSSKKPSNSNLAGIDASSIPADKKGSILDPFSWYDTEDFNVTYTDEAVGGLPIMGLNSTWDDDVQANKRVPKLSDTFEYGKMPIRGVNLGGWLNLEPFITPSFFEKYSRKDGIIDEYTLCSKLGPDRCKETLEQHYSAFVRRQTFTEIRDAGFDHVRIPFGYWMVTTYEGDPYVAQVSWRYLLRAIEWARQHGLRINLDLHGAPGSQNGWNHSGRQGTIGWLNGTDGDLNADRTLQIHHQLSQFFSQPRYKNIITMYGLVNEPRMVDIDTSRVLSWTETAIRQIRKDGIDAVLVFGDGFFGLDNWRGKLQFDDRLLLDVHQYVVFNVDQLSLKHTDKLNFACRGWTQQSRRSMDKTTGFGPTMCGEWSQADTDCTTFINNVGMGTRWEGTYNTGNASTSILKPQCPLGDASCSCAKANESADKYSEAYKKWLYQFAVAQMMSFEEGWGWFYWTWETERAVQWSWRKGMQAGILPAKVWERGFDCPKKLEDFEGLGLEEYY
ncbi:glycoside hydrolase [Westerdykella ornata]|uniref:glucan 1,3-beta-glucosidase n=1 Tax=Westerdykella ornata TaxID=318751 RepID=A0A6A6JS94_WESOR|nr:glycoside hydrolase [Westerdykella ornata]KAF2279134.1 glycoside hydrolase [Westerdykella ornata]